MADAFYSKIAPLTLDVLETTLDPSAAEALYHVRAWGDDYFFVNDEGHVAVRPLWDDDLSIDLYEVVEQVQAKGIRFPFLIRFQDLLRSRVVRLNEAFRSAIGQTGYDGVYQGVYPIKVNQLREVVEEILEAGKAYGYGLECGSKAELAATLPYLPDDDTLLICNGNKDAVMMRLMVAGQQLGKNIIPVLERYDEYEMLRRLAKEVDGTAQFGVRVRLSTTGAGLWSESGGENSKFGISLSELLRLIQRLEADGDRMRFRLLHFHLGSQIAHLQNVRMAVQEATRVYARLYKRGIPLQYLDIGGGLGVNYEAGNPDVAGYINYTIDEYAHAVVSTVKAVCDEEMVPHPTLVSESGRAVTAHHSVFVTEVVAVRRKDAAGKNGFPEQDHPLLSQLAGLLEILRRGVGDLGTAQDSYRVAEELRNEVIELFRRGQLTLEQKAAAERLYWSSIQEIATTLQRLNGTKPSDELAGLDLQLVDAYVCNFSVFRSMVDHWAIGQRFPIMPIHRLDEVPDRRGKLTDLTCDSDGQVDSYVVPEGDKHFLELHPLRPNEPYVLGVFLMGAYQDIMGDMHNLFGRVTEVHVYADATEPGNFYIETILPGSTVEEQLGLVQYFPNDLERRMNDLIQRKVKDGKVRPHAGVKLLEQYRNFFREHTYMNTRDGLPG